MKALKQVLAERVSVSPCTLRDGRPLLPLDGHFPPPHSDAFPFPLNAHTETRPRQGNGGAARPVLQPARGCRLAARTRPHQAEANARA